MRESPGSAAGKKGRGPQRSAGGRGPLVTQGRYRAGLPAGRSVAIRPHHAEMAIHAAGRWWQLPNYVTALEPCSMCSRYCRISAWLRSEPEVGD